jgi:hypothetical protein
MSVDLNHMTLHETAAALGHRPVARLVYLEAPVGESEADFWHRKFSEASLRICALQRVVSNLRDAIDVLEAEA